MTNRRQLLRRALLALVAGTAAFLSIQLLLGLLVERCLPAGRDPEFDSKRAQLLDIRARHPNASLVLVVGSSRTLTGLDAGTAERVVGSGECQVYNFGLAGAGPLMHTVSYRRLRSEGVKPSLLLVEVLPAFLNMAGEHTLEEDWLGGQRLRDSEVTFLAAYHSRGDRLRKQWLKGRSLPCLWQSHRLTAAFSYESTPVHPHDGRGWRSLGLDEVTSDVRAERVWFTGHQYSPVRGPFRPAEGPMRALGDLLALARADGVDAALLLMPEGDSFRGHFAEELRAAVDACLFAGAAASGAPVIDARRWMAEEDFWDGHHLLSGAASRFSTRLAEEELRPRLTRLSAASP